MNTSEQKQRAEKLLRQVFIEVLPRYGYSFRPPQLELAEAVLSGLFYKQLALCEAEVGTGKTHAYLLAAFIYLFETGETLPIVISTSSTALQQAIADQYLPGISSILMAEGFLSAPYRYVIRKGKSRYVCLERLKDCLNSGTELPASFLDGLHRRQRGYADIDLDQYGLPQSIRDKICVTDHCARSCPSRNECRYQHFLQWCGRQRHTIQICNHHYLLADIRMKTRENTGLLPEYCLAVLDEAHKIPECAREVYCAAWGEQEIPSKLEEFGLSAELPGELPRLCARILQINSRIFAQIQEGMRSLPQTAALRLRMLRSKLSLLPSYRGPSREAERRAAAWLKDLDARLNQLLSPETLLWTEGEQEERWIKALPLHYEKRLYRELWEKRLPYVFTSGTLSVNGSFAYFIREAGLTVSRPERRLEITQRSPFNYREQTLLYLSKTVPYPNSQTDKYLDCLQKELVILLRASHGHSLVLFTSYWLMEKTYSLASRELRDYPVFCMGRGRLDALRRYRESKNGVLFAADICGEGLDIPGDLLSLLVITRLPFPIPDTVMEAQRKLYGKTQDFIRGEAVPKMLIRLTQYRGRLIRGAGDSGVYAILDRRAAPGGPYHQDVLRVFHDSPVTSSLGDVEQFYWHRKDKGYFEEPGKEQTDEQ